MSETKKMDEVTFIFNEGNVYTELIEKGKWRSRAQEIIKDGLEIKGKEIKGTSKITWILPGCLVRVEIDPKE